MDLSFVAYAHTNFVKWSFKTKIFLRHSTETAGQPEVTQRITIGLWSTIDRRQTDGGP